MSEREKNVLMTKLMLKIEELSRDMERFNLAEYMNMLSDPRRFLFINLMGGIARGFGIALGFSILGALGIWFMQRLVILNLPIIGDFIAELVKIVQRQL